LSRSTMLPEDYWQLPHEQFAEIAADPMERDGILWLPLARAASSRLFRIVKQRLPDLKLYMASPKPDWDHVIIAYERLPDWIRWLEPLAHERFRLKEKGTADHLLPVLPKGVAPDEPDDC